MFGIYLVLNGIERFLIELIRVNTRYRCCRVSSFTQAEMISTFFGGVRDSIYNCIWIKPREGTNSIK